MYTHVHTEKLANDRVGVEVAALSFMEVFSISEKRNPPFLNHLAPISAGSAVSIDLNWGRLCLCHPREDHYSVAGVV